MKIFILILCLASAFSMSGCLKDFDVSKLVEEPTDYVALEVENADEKMETPEVDDLYVGAYIEVSPVYGEKTRIVGIDYAIQQIMEAYENENLLLDEEASKKGYKNTIKIYDRQDQLLASFQLNSDFLLYARVDKDSQLFLFPEYAYYMIEYALWQENGSLVMPLDYWERTEAEDDDDSATYDTKTIDLRLEHDIKTVVVQMYGYSEAYFVNYEIFATAEYTTDDVLSVRIYSMVSYAGYSMVEQEVEIDEDMTDEEIEAALNADPVFMFTPDYHVETAGRLIYTYVEGKYYRLTDYDEPAPYDEEENPYTLETRVRTIFPYESMDEIMAVLEDTDDILLDFHRQALDYLRLTGQGDIEIDD